MVFDYSSTPRLPSVTVCSEFKPDYPYHTSTAPDLMFARIQAVKSDSTFLISIHLYQRINTHTHMLTCKENYVMLICLNLIIIT